MLCLVLHFPKQLSYVSYRLLFIQKSILRSLAHERRCYAMEILIHRKSREPAGRNAPVNFPQARLCKMRFPGQLKWTTKSISQKEILRMVGRRADRLVRPLISIIAIRPLIKKRWRLRIVRWAKQLIKSPVLRFFVSFHGEKRTRRERMKRSSRNERSLIKICLELTPRWASFRVMRII